MRAKLTQKYLWLALSLLIAISYSLLALQQAFSEDYVVQDDARQHVFWMLRFLDSSFFPNDLIADYFQSVAPAGYTNLYRLASAFGVHPFLFNKCLPLILDLITTSYCFFLCLHLFPIPFAGFLSTLFLNQYLWLRDDLVSGTPTAFMYPLLIAFLYYLVKRFSLASWIAIALLGFFYPQGLLLASAVLLLNVMQKRFSHNKEYRLEIIGLIIACFVMLFYAVKSSQYDPVITAEIAKTMPEFLLGGSSEFFVTGFWEFWLSGKRSGMMPQFAAIVISLGLIIMPWFLWRANWFPLRKVIKSEAVVLVQLTIASIGLFFLAHLLLFQLHLPSRYTEHSLRIVSAIALAIALTIILDAILNWTIRNKRQLTQLLSLTLTTVFLIALLIYPSFFKNFPEANYITGNYPELYQLLENNPKETLIASTTEEVNQLPTFAKRSILVGSEGYPVPYHLGYYKQIRERTIDLIDAQYSSQLKVVQTFIQKYHINFWLLKKSAFSPESIAKDNWLMQYQPAANNAIKKLKAGKIPVLLQKQKDCQVWSQEDLFLLDATCLEQL